MFSLPKRVAFAAVLKLWPSMAPNVFPPLKPRKATEWASRQEAIGYLRHRGMFREFSPESLDYFLKHGLKSSSSGINGDKEVGGGDGGDGGDGAVELMFPAESEAALFKTAPMDVEFLSPSMIGLYGGGGGGGQHAPTPPGHLLYSGEFPFIGRGDVASLRKRLGASLRFRAAPGGHFLPLHDPRCFADLVVRSLDADV
jgi:hypothetical protein